MYTIPIINLKTAPLDIMLYGLGLRLEHLSRSDDADFAKLIKDKELAIQFIGGDVTRYYRFAGGRIGQAAGTAHNADLAIVFKDATTGARLIAKADVSALMSAIQDGDVTITGDLKLVLWLSGVIKHAVKIPEPYQGYIDTTKPYIRQAQNLGEKIFKRK